MNIMIVDDEALILQKLVDMVAGSTLGFQQIFRASNVDEALDIFEKEKPEIILTDIRMPQKSGLDLAKYIHDYFPDHIIILITGYAEFNYAKSGIEYNVFDYILKPIEQQATLACIERAQKSFRQNKKQQNLYKIFHNYFSDNYQLLKRQFLEMLLFHPVEPNSSLVKQQEELFQFSFQEYRLAAFQCLSSMAQPQPEEEYYNTYLVEKYLKEHFSEPICYSFSNILFFLFPYTSGSPAQDKRDLVRLLSQTKAAIESSCSVSLQIGISNASRSIQQLKMLKKQTSLCLDYQKNIPDHDMIFYEDIAQGESAAYDVDDQISFLNTHIKSGNKSQALSTLKDLFEAMRGAPDNLVWGTCNLIISNLSFILHEFHLEQEQVNYFISQMNQLLTAQQDPDLLMQYFLGWVGQICDAINESYKNKGNLIISKVQEYINQNFASQIGLTDAADAVGRNASYVSRLIKQYLGKSFTQILTEKRIAEAKRLLQSTSLKIGEIAEQTGYPNLRYFNRIFSSHVGMTANDYRKVVTTLLIDE